MCLSVYTESEWLWLESDAMCVGWSADTVMLNKWFHFLTRLLNGALLFACSENSDMDTKGSGHHMIIKSYLPWVVLSCEVLLSCAETWDCLAVDPIWWKWIESFSTKNQGLHLSRSPSENRWQLALWSLQSKQDIASAETKCC